MKYLQIYESWYKDWFLKNKKEEEPIIYPSAENQYWKRIFSITLNPGYGAVVFDQKHFNIELIMKFTYEIDLMDDGKGGEYHFDGIWKTAFDWSVYYKNKSPLFGTKHNYVTKQESAKVGDKSEEFIFLRGEWFGLQKEKEKKIFPASQEEIEFYELHDTTNKYNL